jgi:hypothetical protein
MLGQINNHRTSFLRVSGFPRGFGPDSRSRLGAPGWGGGCCAPRLSAWALAPTPRGPPPRRGAGWAGGYGPGAARPGAWAARAPATARDVPSDFAVTSTKSFYRSGLRCTRHVERALFTRFVYKLHVLPLARVRSTLYTPKTQLRGLGGTLYPNMYMYMLLCTSQNIQPDKCKVLRLRNIRLTARPQTPRSGV